MSNRKRINSGIEETILTFSRRRCAICYGLKKDVSIKRGQIAHLDNDAMNNELDNLCFLCLPHHDEYDSTSRQAKSFKILEIKKYRSELYSAIKTEWEQPPSFRQSIAELNNQFDGHYIYKSLDESSEFDIKTLENGNVQVQGFALWGIQSGAPHTGSVDFNSPVQNARVYFTDRLENQWYNLELNFTNDGLEVLEQMLPGYHGMNVTFQGKYRRIK